MSMGVMGEERSWLSPDEKEGRPMGREGEGRSGGAPFASNTPARRGRRLSSGLQDKGS